VIRVVLDANVLVSAALARDPAAPSVRAFDALLDGRIEAVGCPALLGEVAAVLRRERLRRYLSIEEARRFVADLAGIMTLVADPLSHIRLSAGILMTTISSRSREPPSWMRS
jgi:predicted nucleic acid-binding protein